MLTSAAVVAGGVRPRRSVFGEISTTGAASTTWSPPGSRRRRGERSPAHELNAGTYRSPLAGAAAAAAVVAGAVGGDAAFQDGSHSSSGASGSAASPLGRSLPSRLGCPTSSDR